jgi:hypothetical protein
MSVRGLVLLLLLLASGCQTRESDAQPTKAKEPMQDVTMSWSVTKHGSDLQVEYSLTNHTSHTVWAVDDMLTFEAGKLVRAPTAFIVRNGAAGVAQLYRGNVNIPTHDSRLYPSPGMRAIAAGATLKGTGTVAWPLHAWHNYHPDKIDALKTPITKLELSVEVLEDQGPENKDWRAETLGDGGTVQSPFLRVLNERAIQVAEQRAVP